MYKERYVTEVSLAESGIKARESGGVEAKLNL